MQFTKQIPAAYDVAVTGGLGAVLFKTPPLTIGDRIAGITIYLASPYDSGPSSDLTIELYGCNSPPASVTEARNGVSIMSAMTYPMVIQAQTVFDPINGGIQNAQLSFHVSLPLWFRPSADQRHVALVVTSSAMDVDGVAFLRVEPKELPDEMDGRGA